MCTNNPRIKVCFRGLVALPFLFVIPIILITLLVMYYILFKENYHVGRCNCYNTNNIKEKYELSYESTNFQNFSIMIPLNNNTTTICTNVTCHILCKSDEYYMLGEAATKMNSINWFEMYIPKTSKPLN